ncbi:MAG: C-terminal helicase domain-containing protein, partial [Planctomycetota bacterium]
NGATKQVKAESEAASRHADKTAELQARIELAKASDDEEAYKAAVAELQEAARVMFTEMSRLRHETAVAKIPHVVEHVENAIGGSGKVVVFAHHKDVVNGLMDEFGDRAVKLTGETPMAQRQEAVDRFQSDPTIQVFVGNIQAAGVGITLTAASHVVFAELDWVPGNITQAEDRCHRIGQTNSVLVQHLVFDESIDANMAHALTIKQDVLDRALDRREAEVPVVPTTAKHATEPKVPELSEDQVQAIHEGLQMLAGVCDGAWMRDDCGFNKIDTHIGKSLASASRLTQKQAALGYRLCRKYRRQLPEALLKTLALERRPQ